MKDYYSELRANLVRTLAGQGITNKTVLKALLQVERHLFVPEIIRDKAYLNKALPLGYDVTISQPYTVAFMTQALQPEKGMKILEIGTGSGYQAAVLAKIVDKVYTIERTYEIYVNTQKLYDTLAIKNVLMRWGDGTVGWNDYAPYDGIIVTAGSPKVPPALLKQLKIGGRMVIPVGDSNSQEMYIITKLADNNFSTEKEPNFSFVPLIGKEGWEG